MLPGKGRRTCGLNEHTSDLPETKRRIHTCLDGGIKNQLVVGGPGHGKMLRSSVTEIELLGAAAYVCHDAERVSNGRAAQELW
jgi:hypothetical protein